MLRREVLRDVPEDVIDRVVSDFESEGAQVTKEKQPNGKWTLVATFPSSDK
jgi:hypothetical protein